MEANRSLAAADAAEQWPASSPCSNRQRRRGRSTTRTGGDTRVTSARSSRRSASSPIRRGRATRRSVCSAPSSTRLSGYDGDPKLLTAFPSEAKAARAEPLGQIVEGPIAFHALCEHHALPFYGVAHVGYVAGDEIIGISKLTRLVRLFSKRFTVQERVGEQIADTLMELIAPAGVAVHLEASHLCTRMRGVEEHSATVTTFWRGAFADPALRQEFLTEVHGRKSVV